MVYSHNACRTSKNKYSWMIQKPDEQNSYVDQKGFCVPCDGTFYRMHLFSVGAVEYDYKDKP